MLAHLAAFVALVFETFVIPGIPLTAPRPVSLVPAVLEVPNVSAPSVFLIDIKNRKILVAKYADESRPIASITKLMTALVLLDAKPDWNRQVTFESKDQRAGDIARIFPGEEVTLGDAWKLMLVASSNDATALLARVISGDEKRFVEAMNKKAQEVGLLRTHFADPTGLDAENTSTAREVAIMARLALSFPEIRDTVSQRQVVFTPKGKARRVVFSTDQLLGWFSMPGVQFFGGKTGHIEESGYNLVVAAGDESREFMGVVLGAGTNSARFKEMGNLIKWGFKNAGALGD